jgi:hypothetical protein
VRWLETKYGDRGKREGEREREEGRKRDGENGEIGDRKEVS